MSSKDQLNWIKANNLNMKYELYPTTNHDTALNLGCDYGLYFLNYLKLKFIIKKTR